MGVRLTQVPQDSTTGESTDPIGYTVEADGQSYFFAPNQTRNFMNDGVGNSLATCLNEDVGGNAEPQAGVIEDNSSSAKYRPNTHPSRY
jgi:hypothetical protein